ncbi:MAG: spermidine/putrescine ABC transporter substrate-binding protein [Pseudomonadota bacterium]
MRAYILMLTAMVVLLGAPMAGAKEELKIFIWSEYMDEVQMTQDFEAKTGIKVKLDLYESNEDMLAKLQAGGVRQYDIIVPSDYILPTLINLKLIQKLDHAKLPNLKNLFPRFTETTFDPGNVYTVGWQWGTVGLVYNTKKIKAEDAASWSILFDPAKNPGPFCLIDSVRDMLGVTLAYLGYDYNSINPKELKAAADLLVKTKKRSDCLGFKGGVGGKNDVVSGVAAAAVVYNGDAIKAISESADNTIAFTVPKEGGTLWIDSMCIPAQAPNPDAAHKWINWVLEPEVGAALSNYNHYASPNEASVPFIAKEDLDNPGVWPSKETALYYIKDLGENNTLVDQTWTMVKSH